MKHLILIAFLLSLSSCDGQNKKKPIQKTTAVKNKTPHIIKEDTMEYFNIDKYKDWEIDSDFSSSDDHKFLKKRNERVEINFLSDGIQVRLRNFNSPYEKIKGYSNSTKFLVAEGLDFYGSPIDKTIQYNEKHQIVKEIDYETPYKFTIEDLIEKIKKEYKVDLGDKSEGSAAGRTSKDGVFYYEVFLRHKTGEQKMEYLLIDGTTGKTVLKSDFHVTP
jgi:hypothetical protein